MNRFRLLGIFTIVLILGPVSSTYAEQALVATDQVQSATSSEVEGGMLVVGSCENVTP